MAKQEVVDGDIAIMNVDEKVGVGKPNGWSDVMIVQALLKYIREGKGGDRIFDYLPGEPPLRNPDGFFSSGRNGKTDFGIPENLKQKKFWEIPIKRGWCNWSRKGQIRLVSRK